MTDGVRDPRLPDPISVVIVDDSDDLRLMFSMLFRTDQRFVQVGEATNGVDALQLVESVRPDLVLLDIEMPRMNGLEVLGAMADWPIRPVVVVLTGVSHIVAGEQALASGADAYFTKDVDPNQLLDEVYDAYGMSLSAPSDQRPTLVGTPDVAEAAESRRLAAVHRLDLLDSDPEEIFDTITDLVAAALDAPMAMFTIVDEHRQWFKSKLGVDVTGSPRAGGFCAHAIQSPTDLLVVHDASTDDRFSAHDMVTGAPGIRFYAGAVVRSPEGEPIGTLCVLDDHPRDLDAGETALIGKAARQVEALIAARVERNDAVNEQSKITSRHLELEQAVQDRVRFLAVAQHKLKTPLAVIAGWGATLSQWDQLSTDERRIGLDAINRSAAELQAQIDDLLDEARSQLLEQQIDIDSIVLADFVEGIIDPWRHSSDHSIEVSIAGDLVVRADVEALRQVLAHLLDNAVKYSAAGQAIKISARSHGDSVQVRVRDNGIGIPDDVDIFAPFQRGTTSGGVARGTGLGLYIVRSLLNSMGGSVEASNHAGGADVEISLPRN